MKLYNTLSRQLEEIKPNKDGIVTVYNCGLTVYSRPQIGNLRAYVNWDVLYRALVYLGYSVKRIMNFTDVGHMTNDDDLGEEKLDREAKRLGKDPWAIADMYIIQGISDFKELNILSPSGKILEDQIDPKKVKEYGWTRATEYVDEMIKLVVDLEKNGFTYETDQAVYFDVKKYSDYSKMSGQSIEDKRVENEEEKVVDNERKHPADFVLWMKKKGKYENHIMEWDSPWGKGFPGWHIECSAMGLKELGDFISIHTGGVDHIPIHHSNERAQNFGATGKEVVDMWVHNEFLTTSEGGKLSKSLGNSYTIDDIRNNGFDPLDLRYYFLSINYRMPIKFSQDGLQGARNARLSLLDRIGKLLEKSNSEGVALELYKKQFKEALSNDLNMSGALAVISSLLKSDEKPEDIVTTITDFDKVLGLNLTKKEDIPEDVSKLAQDRLQAKKIKDFITSDRIRNDLLARGYEILDNANGFTIKKKK